jgi:hypothetical protein
VGQVLRRWSPNAQRGDEGTEAKRFWERDGRIAMAAVLRRPMSCEEVAEISGNTKTMDRHLEEAGIA